MVGDGGSEGATVGGSDTALWDREEVLLDDDFLYMVLFFTNGATRKDQ